MVKSTSLWQSEFVEKYVAPVISRITGRNSRDVLGEKIFEEVYDMITGHQEGRAERENTIRGLLAQYRTTTETGKEIKPVYRTLMRIFDVKEAA